LQEISYNQLNDFSRRKDHQEFLHKLLTSKDSFIRKKIIDQNLAYLNNRLNHYLEKLGLPHEVRFLNDLSVEITELGREFDFDNLSRGERNKLIFGLSFAFRDVWESLNNSINLFFIDELIDSGFDQIGVENTLCVLKAMGRDRLKDVFLISHREELLSRVSKVMLVRKEGGFTTFSNDLEEIENIEI
jgi:DNA repair exonuclease SbcCD ATPase subunit